MITAAKGFKGSPTQRHILFILADCHNGLTGQCNPSIAFLMQATGFSNRTIATALQKLEAAGQITVFRTRGGRHCYQLHPSLTGRIPASSALAPEAQAAARRTAVGVSGAFSRRAPAVPAAPPPVAPASVAAPAPVVPAVLPLQPRPVVLESPPTPTIAPVVAEAPATVEAIPGMPRNDESSDEFAAFLPPDPHTLSTQKTPHGNDLGSRLRAMPGEVKVHYTRELPAYEPVNEVHATREAGSHNQEGIRKKEPEGP